jgi:hypothetical protein
MAFAGGMIFSSWLLKVCIVYIFTEAVCTISCRGSISKYLPAKPGALRLLDPQRGLIAIGRNQNREPFIVGSFARILVAVIPAKAGIQSFSGFRVAFHLPGMTILYPGTVKLWEAPSLNPLFPSESTLMF